MLHMHSAPVIMKHPENFVLLFLTTLEIFAIFSEHHSVEASIRSNCSGKEFGELESILEELVGFDKNQRAFPNNPEEAKKYCGQVRKDITSLDRLFKTCFKGSSKHFSTVLLYSLKASVKAYCNAKNKRKFDDFLQLSKCINKPESRKVIASEIEKYIDTMQRAKSLQPAKDGVGYACCDYFKLINNVERRLEASCTEKEIQISVDFIRNLLQSLIDMGCGDFSDRPDTCNKLSILPKKNRNQRRYGSFLLPLVDFWNQLD